MNPVGSFVEQVCEATAENESLPAVRCHDTLIRISRVFLFA